MLDTPSPIDSDDDYTNLNFPSRCVIVCIDMFMWIFMVVIGLGMSGFIVALSYACVLFILHYDDYTWTDYVCYIWVMHVLVYHILMLVAPPSSPAAQNVGTGDCVVDPVSRLVYAICNGEQILALILGSVCVVICAFPLFAIPWFLVRWHAYPPLEFAAWVSLICMYAYYVLSLTISALRHIALRLVGVLVSVVTLIVSVWNPTTSADMYILAFANAFMLYVAILAFIHAHQSVTTAFESARAAERDVANAHGALAQIEGRAVV